MKSYQLIVIALVVACASAFAPASQRPTFQPLAASKLPEPIRETADINKDNKAAAMAAFATALAPMAANAASVDEGTVIGYGAGLVECVVSLAVGFSIGYGTLVKP